MVVQFPGLDWSILFITYTTLIITKVIFAIYLGKLISHKKKEKDVIELDLVMANFILFLGLIISRIFHMIYEYFVLDFIFYKIAILISNICVSIVIFIADKEMLNFRFKGILAYLTIVVTLIQTFYPVFQAVELIIYLIISVIPGLLSITLPFIFFYSGYKNPEIKRIGYLISIGISFYIIGAFIVNALIFQFISAILLTIISVILKINGFITIIYGLEGGILIEEEKIPDSLDILKYIKNKPKTITEKEITFYREQKICLVCKGKAIGRTFIHECDALYCLICADALIQIDNLCWICQNALDDTKPIKMLEWVDDKILIPEDNEDKPKKKK